MEEREEERVCVAEILWDVHVMVVKMNYISVLYMYMSIYICGCSDTCKHTCCVLLDRSSCREKKSQNTTEYGRNKKTM